MFNATVQVVWQAQDSQMKSILIDAIIASGQSLCPTPQSRIPPLGLEPACALPARGRVATGTRLAPEHLGTPGGTFLRFKAHQSLGWAAPVLPHVPVAAAASSGATHGALRLPATDAMQLQALTVTEKENHFLLWTVVQRSLKVSSASVGWVRRNPAQLEQLLWIRTDWITSNYPKPLQRQNKRSQPLDFQVMLNVCITLQCL